MVQNGVSIICHGHAQHDAQDETDEEAHADGEDGPGQETRNLVDDFSAG